MSPVSSAVTLPSRNTSTRSQSTDRSAASTDEMITPQPSAAASRIASMMSCLAPTSTAWVGSCSTSRSGSPASHLPSSTFCWLPPDRVPTSLYGSGGLMSSFLIMAAVSSACHAWPIRSLLPRARTRGSVRFCVTDSSPARPCSRRRSATNATPARMNSPVESRLGFRLIFLPLMASVPALASRAPPIASATATAPEPTSPVSPTISPFFRSRSSPLTERTTRFRTWAAVSSRARLSTRLCVTRCPPSISRVRPASSVSSVGMPISTTWPSRITVTRSVTSTTSSS